VLKKIPTGMAENSPPIHRWGNECSPANKESRQGRLKGCRNKAEKPKTRVSNKFQQKETVWKFGISGVPRDAVDRSVELLNFLPTI